MRQTTCSKCNASVPLQSSFSADGWTYCASCVQTAAREAKDSGQARTFARNVDGSVCALCGSENASGADFVYRKRLPFCEECGPKVEKWPYPQWLKLSLAGLVFLLIVSLVYGQKYFHAGREMYLGERLVKGAKYAEAEPHLKEAVRIAPNSDKAVLLLAKAALKTGDTETAGKALQGHGEGHFENGQDEDFLEVKTLWERALAAIEKANKASELAQQDGKEAEAAKLIHEAAAQYPESRDLGEAARQADAGVAFANKDYDTFLSFAQKDYAERADGSNAGRLASAWACKYAAT